MANEQSGFPLLDAVAVLRRRRWLIAAVLGLCVGGALVMTAIQTPKYRAKADLLIRRTASAQVILGQENPVTGALDAERQMNTELQVIKSRAVRDAVRQVYDGPLSVENVSVSTGELTDVVTLSVESANPTEAAALANTYAEEYVEFRRESDIEDLVGAADQFQSRLAEVQARLADIDAPLKALDAQITEAGDDRATVIALTAQREALTADLRPQRDAVVAQISFLQQQLDELEITEEIAQSGGVQVLSAAGVPSSPVSPVPAQNLLLALIVGGFLAVGIAFAVDFFDDSIKSKEALEATTGLPTLAIVPAQSARKGEVVGLIGKDPVGPQFAESYRSLRTSVQFLQLDKSAQVLQVTSAEPSEGKTVTAANLAITLALAGQRVLIVDADLRRPRIHELFQIERRPGLTDVLLGRVSLLEAVQPSGIVANLHVLTCGELPPNPAELLGSRAMGTLAETLAAAFDHVVIDCAPLLPVTDARVMAPFVDGTLLLAAQGQASKRSVARAVEQLQLVDAPLLGAVLNKAEGDAAYYTGDYGYYDQSTPRPPVASVPLTQQAPPAPSQTVTSN